jgi:flavin reductase (DIM6/NTAB) family NADH-FMN oxidoreductase RutF
VTIHSEHPFLEPPSSRDPVRRLRGRLGGTVTLWTTGGPEAAPAGLTISSRMIAAGDPGHALALIDPVSTFAETLAQTRTAVMHGLSWEHRVLADAFAGITPAPGGVFRMGEWTDTAWGPLLSGVDAWAGLRLVDGEMRPVGWSVLADAVIERVEISGESQPLVHRRGRYQRPAEQ